MSIPLVQNNEKDSINTSIIAIKRNIERINMLLGLSNSEEIDTSKFATKDELQQAVTDLQPVNEVTADNMQSVTSNAVANTLNTVTVQSFPNAGVILHNIGKVCWCTYVGSLSGYQSGWRYEGIIPPGLRPDTDVRVVMVNNTLDSYGGQAVIRAASGDVVFYRPGGGTFSSDTFAASWAWIAS